MAVQIQIRRGTASQWTSTNPLLAQGEMGFETDTLKVKYGDGVTYWNSLSYYSSGAVTSVTGTAPIVSSGGLTPAISIPAASTSVGGYLTSTDWNTFNNKGYGTVTSVSGTGTVNGLTLTGTVTASGSLTLGGTLSGIANSALTNSSITINGSSVSLGGSATITATASAALTIGSGLSGTSYNGSTAVTIANTGVLSFSGGTTGLTPATATTGAVTLAGTLAVANGGTGVTTSSGANSVVLRDANQNIAVNALDDNYVNTAASGTAITLTVSSARRYTITGSGGQVIKLPDATTLVNGAVFQFDNNQSSGAITVNNNSNTLIVSVPSGGFVLVNLLSNSIAAGSWDRHDQAPSNVSWSTNTFDYAGSITSATWNGVAIAINRGGTGASTAAAALTNLGAYPASNPSGYTNNTGTVTSVSGTGTVSGISLSGTVTSSGSLTLGGTLDLSSPPAIGSTAASTGAFTTLSASSTVSGTGFDTYLASPPAIGGTAAAAGTFTTLTGTTSTTTPIVQNSAAAAIAFKTNHTASAVNYVQVTGAGAGNPPVISSQGATTPDLDLTLTPKGAGRVNITTSIKPKVNSTTSVTSPLAWNSTSYDEYALTALANALTISADANTAPADGQRMMFRFKDNGTAQTLTWTTGSTNSFRVVGVTLPTTTVASKLLYVGCIYNAADSRWDAIAVGQEV